MKDLKTTIIVTAGLLLGSFFSYLLQFYLGRVLSVADYGTFNTLLSIAAILGVPATVFGTSLIKETSVLLAKNENAKISALFWQSIIWTVAFGLIIFGGLWLAGANVFSVIKLSDPKLLGAFNFYLALTFVSSMPPAFLQGLLQYTSFALLTVVAAALRFILPFVLLKLHLDVSNVFIGSSLSLILAVLLGYVLLKKYTALPKSLNVTAEMVKIAKFSWPVLVTNLCLMSFNNNDLILVRSYFSPEQAGYYAGVVTLGKILLFGSTPVATVMFPKISKLFSEGASVAASFWNFLKMQLGLSFIGVMIFVLFPKIISMVFFGEKFSASIQYLPAFSIFIFFYVLLNFLILFLFAIDKTAIYHFLVLLTVTQGILISNFHTSLFQVIYVNIGVLLLGVIIAFAMSAHELRHK